MLRYTTILVILLTCAISDISFAFENEDNQNRTFQFSRLSPTTWRITVECEPPRIEMIEGRHPFSRVSIPGFLIFTREGLPQLPMRKFNFAIPTNGSLQYKIIQKEESFLAAELQPYVTTHDDELNPSGNMNRKQPDLKKMEIETFSVPLIKISDKIFFGDNESQSIEIFPARYDQQSKTVTYLKKIIVEVNILGDERQSAQAAGGSGKESPVLKKYFINGDDAYKWRSSQRRVQPQIRASWYDPNRSYIKMYVKEKGIYRITKSMLDTLGVDWLLVDPKSLQVFNRGSEQPIYVFGEDDRTFDTGDYLEFIGDMNHGEGGEYYDLWSDENVYWFSWGGPQGKRFTSESITSTTEPPLPATTQTIHLEEDRIYHPGDTDDDGDNSDYIPGKNWVWKYLFKKDSLMIPFNIIGLDQSGGQAMLALRIKGSSKDPSRIQIYVNNNVVDQFDIGSWDLETKIFLFPSSLLKEGNNTLLIYDVGIVDCPPTDPTCTIERVYIDWADITYRYSFKARDDRISFRDTIATNKFIASISNFSSDNIIGYNVTGSSKISGITPTVNGSRFDFTGAFHPGEEYNFGLTSSTNTPVRFEKDIPSDWSDANHGADHIIITHGNFIKQANRLAQYRAAKDGFRTAVVDVKDLYDEFNFGIKHPIAIRNFLATTYSTWTSPKPKFVLILGDASWDPKFLLSSSTKVDYVPVWGNPASDNYFVAFNNDRDVLPKMSNGRIPCETPQAADDVIDKIISYESAPQQHWQKRILFVNGGKTKWEHSLFLGQSENLIRRFIDPFCLDKRRIYRKTEEIISFAELDTIISEVNQGSLWFQFVGHGGTRIIDVGIERPDIFSNKDRYTFFVTMSCNTAHFAEPNETGLSELFVMAKNNGSIATYGTAGRGVLYYIDFLSDRLFEGLSRDSIRTFGELSTRAKIAMVNYFSGSDQIIRNTVNQYVIFGDPATQIPVPLGPELAVSSVEVTTNPEIIVENNTTTISAVLYNDGLCLADTIDVEFTHTHKNKVVESIRKRIPPFAIQSTQTVDFNFIGMVGLNTFAVTIDPDGKVIEKNEADNSATIQRIVAPQGITQIFPLDHAVIHPNGNQASVDFLVGNPSYMPVDTKGNLLESTDIEIQIARDVDFQNIASTIKQKAGKTYTTLNTTLTSSENVMYVWRTRLVTPTTSGDWSAMRYFTVQSGSGEEWYQNTFEQLQVNQMSGCSTFPDGTIRNTKTAIYFKIVSAGNNNIEISNFADIVVNGKNVSPNRRGFNIAVFDRTNGRLIDTTVFDTYWTSANADAMADYLDRYDSTHLIIVAVKDDANGYPDVIPNRTNINQKLKNRMKEFGSLLIDSVGFRDSYALLGVRGLPSFRREMHRIFGAAFFDDTITVNSTSGTVTSIFIGPATRWDSFSWKDSSRYAGSGVSYSIRVVAGDVEEQLMTIPQGGSTYSLSSIAASQYSYIRIEAILNDSTGIQSPILDWWKVKFESLLPEFGVNSQSVFNEEDSVSEGNPIYVHVQVSNRGRSFIQRLPLVLRYSDRSAQGIIESTSIIQDVLMNSEREVTFQIPSAGYRGLKSYEIALDPNDSLVEYYASNNYFTKTFFVKKDDERPNLEVLFDGQQIANNDYVAPKPQIDIRLIDASPLAVTDTSSMQMFLDGRRIFLINNPQVSYVTSQSGKEKVSIQYFPQLNPGRHSLAVNGKDASGNFADTLAYQVQFYVSSTNRIDQLFPYPNPSSGPISFTFRTIGTAVPERGKIKIYTVAGRLIKEILIPPQSLRIGFNRVDWDGLDEEGDRLANGVYFYKLILERSGSEETFIDRIAILK